MHNYIEFFLDSMPAKVVIGLMLLFGILQAIGELLEFKGKVVPEIMKVRKYFKRKKEERVALSKMTDLLEEHQQMANIIIETNRLLADLDKHYSNDNIAKRDKWMKEVNEHIAYSDEIRKEQDALMRELNEKLDKNNSVTLSILIENKKSAIIDFASKVIDENYPVTREQFNRAFKTYKEYEEIIEEHGLTNGEVVIAIHIIQESYEQHMKNHTFIEDVRGYNV
jgi:hypothetical protein